MQSAHATAEIATHGARVASNEKDIMASTRRVDDTVLTEEQNGLRLPLQVQTQSQKGTARQGSDGSLPVAERFRFGIREGTRRLPCRAVSG
jgi:hypothetical protein